MQRSMLKSKIHRATVTEADLGYEGSLTVDASLMIAADIIPFEQVMVYNISNGERFETYVIEGPSDSGTICLNGAAARKGAAGDLLIVASYGRYAEGELSEGMSIIVSVDEKNRIIRRSRIPWK
jgi:aspartate 1-decarboxylase